MTRSADRGTTAVVISDLHLAAGRHDPFSDDLALAAFLDALARRAAAGARLRLVLLGDTLDFALVEHDGRRLDPTVPGALARLERIAGAHSDVFAALARAAGAGVAIDIVPGNHDLELLAPAVLDVLRGLLTGRGGSVTLHPWMLHLPGVAYLEHGQQHHDINRVPRLLEAGAGEQLPLPAGTIYGEHLLALNDLFGADIPIERLCARSMLAAARRHPARLARAVRPSLAAVRNLARCQRAARTALRAAAPSNAYASARCLPRETVGALQHATASTPAGAVRRRLLGRRAHEPYMVGGARSAYDLLAAAGQAVPFYVFAHTHVADDRPLTSNPAGPRYLNAGTWSRLAPHGARRCSYVELRCDDAPTAKLLCWLTDPRCTPNRG